jgi:hypothetical protein
MSDETERAKEIDEAVKAADAKKRADAEEAAHQGQTLDKILSCLDSLGKRMDSYDEERKADAARRKDADGDQNSASGEPEPAGGAGARLPSDKEGEDEDREEIESLAKERGDPVPLAADSAKYRRYTDSLLAEIQSHIGRAYDCWGKSARAPWDLERPSAYRRRILAEVKTHSPAWKDVDLHELRGQALRNAQAQIIADSIAASSSSESYGDVLREVRRRDPDTGHTIKEYYGSPMAWMSQFCSRNSKAKFNFDAINRRER